MLISIVISIVISVIVISVIGIVIGIVIGVVVISAELTFEKLTDASVNDVTHLLTVCSRRGRQPTGNQRGGL